MMEEPLQKLKNASLIIIPALLIIIILLGIMLITEDQQLAQARKTPIINNYAPAKTITDNNPAPVAMQTNALCQSEFIITASNYKFTPDQITVHKGDRVKIMLKNREGFHDLTIPGFHIATPRIGAEKETSIQFTANKTGNFEFIDSVSDHSDEFGQKGTLIVQ